MANRSPWNDYRTVLTVEFRTLISRVGFQAFAVDPIVREGADASLCGVPLSHLGTFEDLDEPVCQKCIAEHAKLVAPKVH